MPPSDADDLTRDDLLQKIKDLESKLTNLEQVDQAFPHLPLSGESAYWSLISAIPDAVTLSTIKDGTIIDVNDASLAMSGYAKEEILGKTTTELDFWLDPERRGIMVKKLKTDGFVKDFEFRFKRITGEIAYGLLSARPIDFRGQKCLLAVTKDISDQKLTEMHLIRSKELLHETGQLAKIGAWEMDLETSSLYWTEETFRIHGLPPGKEPTLQEAIKFYVPEARPIVKKAVADLSDTGKAFDLELPFVKATGEPIWVRAIGRRREVDDSPTHIYGAFLDVTDKKHAEDIYERNLNLLNDTGQMAQVGGWEIDLSTMALKWTKETFRIHGLDPNSDPSLQDAINFYAPEARPTVEKAVEELMGSGKPFNFELPFIKATGERIWVRAIGKRRDVDGIPTHIYGAFQDITTQKENEILNQSLTKKLQRAERLESIGLLAGGVAHDLNNILVPLVSYPDLIKLMLPEDDPAIVHLDQIKTAAVSASNVISDLLTLARKSDVDYIPTQINDILSNYFESSGFQKIKTDYPEIGLNLHLADDLLNISGSETHLQKIVMNLVINAFHSINRVGSVTVVTQNIVLKKKQLLFDIIPAGEYVMLEVIDTGMGIEASKLENIFDPFFTTKEKSLQSGTGLGLSIVHGVIRDHHGFVHVESNDSAGTKFCVFFPANHQELVPVEKGSQELTGVESVLVVDDSVAQLIVMQSILEPLGYTVTCFERSPAAITYLKSNSADVVLLDMIMGDQLNGLETYKEILKFKTDQKVLLVSGYSETADVKEALSLGAKGYIKKPYTMAEIALAIRKLF